MIPADSRLVRWRRRGALATLEVPRASQQTERLARRSPLIAEQSAAPEDAPFPNADSSGLETGSLPLVSVLTPSFNQAVWLEDNLASVACQTYPRIEHIVADGGSNDGSLAILEEAGDSIVWSSEPDKGQSDAINKAFARSAGEIIGWINSDDAYFDCRVVDDVVAYFSAHPDIDVVYGHCLQITGDGRAIQVLWAPPFNLDLWLCADPQMQPATFVRRSALTEPMLDESFHFAMDYELWLRLATSGHRFGRLNRIAAIDRHQSERKSRTIRDINEADLARLNERYHAHLTPEYEPQRSAFYKRQRLMGALLIPRLGGPKAFTTSPEFKRGLWKRQVVTRKSAWPDEFR